MTGAENGMVPADLDLVISQASDDEVLWHLEHLTPQRDYGDTA